MTWDWASLFCQSHFELVQFCRSQLACFWDSCRHRLYLVAHQTPSHFYFKTFGFQMNVYVHISSFDCLSVSPPVRTNLYIGYIYAYHATKILIPMLPDICWTYLWRSRIVECRVLRRIIRWSLCSIAPHMCDCTSLARLGAPFPCTENSRWKWKRIRSS